jgi:hypothetical protein
MENSNKYIIYPKRKRGRPRKDEDRQAVTLLNLLDAKNGTIELLHAKNRTEALLIKTMQEYVDFTMQHCNEYAHAINERASSLKECLKHISEMREMSM